MKKSRFTEQQIAFALSPISPPSLCNFQITYYYSITSFYLNYSAKDRLMYYAKFNSYKSKLQNKKRQWIHFFVLLINHPNRLSIIRGFKHTDRKPAGSRCSIHIIDIDSCIGNLFCDLL